MLLGLAVVVVAVSVGVVWSDGGGPPDESAEGQSEPTPTGSSSPTAEPSGQQNPTSTATPTSDPDVTPTVAVGDDGAEPDVELGFVPDGWDVADEVLNWWVSDPSEVLTVASYSLPGPSDVNDPVCGVQLPWSAVEPLSDGDVVVWVTERHGISSEFDPRPASFERSDLVGFDCGELSDVVETVTVEFNDAGRNLSAWIVASPSASEETWSDLLALLDSLDVGVSVPAELPAMLSEFVLGFSTGGEVTVVDLGTRHVEHLPVSSANQYGHDDFVLVDANRAVTVAGTQAVLFEFGPLTARSETVLGSAVGVYGVPNSAETVWLIAPTTAGSDIRTWSTVDLLEPLTVTYGGFGLNTVVEAAVPSGLLVTDLPFGTFVIGEGYRQVWEGPALLAIGGDFALVRDCQAPASGSGCYVAVVDLATGTRTDIAEGVFDLRSGAGFLLSPDGRTATYFQDRDERRFGVTDLSTGETVNIPNNPETPGAFREPVAITPDGQWLLLYDPPRRVLEAISLTDPAEPAIVVLERLPVDFSLETFDVALSD